MKTLKSFASGCCSETLLQETLSDGKGEAATSAKADESGPSGAKEKEGDVDETENKLLDLVDTLPPAPPYHAGLGARFKYPGDPRKLREKSKMKLWKDYLRGEWEG